MSDTFNVKVEIVDKTQAYLDRFNDAVDSFLHEVKDMVATQAGQLTPVDSGELRRSFTEDSYVDETQKVAWVGSSKPYAPYVEYGTGEYALYGNGRKGGWVYHNAKDDKFYHTNGQSPRRMLYHAKIIKTPAIIAMAKERFEK